MPPSVVPTAPLVSVVMPVYNGARFLSDAIESVRAQTYASVELIVVDDGSTDETAAVARSFPQVHYLYQPNQGNGLAKQTGVAAAHGEFLAFLDADDLWAPEKLARQVEHLQTNPEVALVLSYMRNFLEPGVERPVWLPPLHLGQPVPALSWCTLLTRREIFHRVGPFAPTYSRYANDLEWFARAQDAGLHLSVLPDVLLHRRIHATNLTHTTYPDRHRVQFEIMKASLERKRARHAS